MTVVQCNYHPFNGSHPSVYRTVIASVKQIGRTCQCASHIERHGLSHDKEIQLKDLKNENDAIKKVLHICNHIDS